MKCPQCGNEMTLDTHRKISLMMCYDCGYIEGRNVGPKTRNETNYEHIKTLNFNELVAFLAVELKLPEEKIADWLDDETK